MLRRDLMEVNTDPQRRCYNGCHAKSELRWTEWVVLEYELPEDKVGRRLEFWRELNDYAISLRGESARAEFKAQPSL
jgi:hypothetical protein